jgi:hypothetical protein
VLDLEKIGACCSDLLCGADSVSTLIATEWIYGAEGVTYVVMPS